jgi:hypothetical protein
MPEIEQGKAKEGDVIRVKDRVYNWHGRNGAIGKVLSVERAYGLWVEFGNGHKDYINPGDVIKVDQSTTLTECGADSGCQRWTTP